MGTAPTFAAAMLWMSEHVTVSNKVGSALSITASVGHASLTTVLGQHMDDFPMGLMFLNLVIICGCIILLVLAYILIMHKRPEDKIITENESLK